MIVFSYIVYSDSLRSDPDLPSFLLQFCKQVVDGLVCLAGKSFVHRDIAARNILLDKELNCKVRGGGRRECSEVSVFAYMSSQSVYWEVLLQIWKCCGEDGGWVLGWLCSGHVAGSECVQLRLHWRVTNECVGLHGPTPDF